MPLCSLSSFCKERGFPKTSVHTYLTQTLKFNISQGLSIQAQEAAIAKFSKRGETPASEVHVSGGAPLLNPSLPIAGGSVRLDQFRSGPLQTGFSNGGDFVDRMNEFLDQIEEGFDVAVQVQTAELQDARQQRRQVSKRLGQFRTKASEFSVKSSILSDLQGAASGELQEIAAELMSIVAPSSPNPPQSN